MTDTVTSVIPSDPKLEHITIRHLVKHPDTLNRVALFLLPEAFTLPHWNAVFTGLLAMHSRAKPIDIHGLATTLLELNLYDKAGGLDRLEALANEQDVRTNIIERAAELHDIFLRREELVFRDQVSNTLYDRSIPTVDRLARYEQELNRIRKLSLQTDRGVNKQQSLDYHNNLMNRRIKTFKDPKLRLPWPAFNRYIPSLQGGTFVTIIALSGAGKTSFKECLGESWANDGWRGVFYHLELSTDTMIDRRIARHSGIPLQALQDGRENHYEYFTQSDWDSYFLAQEKIDAWQGDLTLIHCPGWTMRMITADMRERVEAEGASFFIVDYFQKVRTESRSKGSYTTYDIGQDLEDFTTCIGQLGVVGVMSSQVDKDAKGKKRFRTKDARNTAELDDKGNINLVIKREFDTNTNRFTPQAEILIDKCNSGVGGVVELYFNGARYLFHDGGTRNV